MKEGKIKDEGSILALKDKYHKGFKIIIKLKDGSKIEESDEETFSKRLQADLKEKYAVI